MEREGNTRIAKIMTIRTREEFDLFLSRDPTISNAPLYHAMLCYTTIPPSGLMFYTQKSYIPFLLNHNSHSSNLSSISLPTSHNQTPSSPISYWLHYAPHTSTDQTPPYSPSWPYSSPWSPESPPRKPNTDIVLRTVPWIGKLVIVRLEWVLQGRRL